MDYIKQFFKQKDYDTRGLPYLLLLRNIVRVMVIRTFSSPPSSLISDQVHPQSYDMILSHLTANCSL
jgi:hypothetical protein